MAVRAPKRLEAQKQQQQIEQQKQQLAKQAGS